MSHADKLLADITEALEKGVPLLAQNGIVALRNYLWAGGDLPSAEAQKENQEAWVAALRRDRILRRRGSQWDVFDTGRSLEIERCDDATGTVGAFAEDDDATAWVLQTACAREPWADSETVEECRAAIREIVASWPEPAL